ncbi:MAG: 16S rRNA (adenine(1518)-N(6)/adenine(1519)-N(6))-dimethyltransferase RsmA, partial [Candidatus Omnitrophota bacterium]
AYHMLTESKIKQLLRQRNLRPKKHLGQNFLVDANTSAKILEHSGVSGDDTVMEIGAGAGSLTLGLCRLAKKVIAVERDKQLCAVLEDSLSQQKNLKIICADFLKVDLKELAPKGRIKIIGNLPYCITTPIIEKIIENRSLIEYAVVMVQKEVGLRLAASPGTKDYGSITCYVQYYTKPRIMMDIKKTVFFPRPEVDSVVVKLDVPDKPSVPVKDEALLFKAIRLSFGQRRKTLAGALSHRSALGMAKPGMKDLLNSVGIDPMRRGETLSLEEFARLSDAVLLTHSTRPKPRP